MKIQSILVEGGGSTITSFLESGLFDELNVYIAPKFFGQGIPLFKSKGENKNKYNSRRLELCYFAQLSSHKHTLNKKYLIRAKY